MTDREHRIDTGSPEERVKQVYPDAEIARLEHATPYTSYVVRINGHSRIERWLTGFHKTPNEAWADASSRLETK